MTTFNLNGNNWANSDNMGKKLLEKAGWSKGEGVGKYKQGTKVHIKVSVKKEKDGIGLKSEKRENELGLMQSFQFDNLLKSKYCKQKEICDDEKIIERGLSRARYGRAVPKEFFKPVSTDAWDKILCKNKVDDNCAEKTETPQQEISNSDKSENFNFKSNYTIYEYFSLKMQNKKCNSELSDFNYDNFIMNKMDALQSFIKSRNASDNDRGMNELQIDGHVEENDLLVGKKKRKLTEENTVSDDSVPKRRKKSELNEVNIDGDTTQSESVNVAEKKKKSKKRKSGNEIESIVHIETEKQSGNAESDVTGRKKKSKQSKNISELGMTAEETNHQLQADNAVGKRKKSKDITNGEIDGTTDLEMKIYPDNENAEKIAKKKKSKKSASDCEVTNITEAIDLPRERISKKKSGKTTPNKELDSAKSPEEKSNENKKKSKKRKTNGELEPVLLANTNEQLNTGTDNKSDGEVLQQSRKQKSPKKSRKTETPLEGELNETVDKDPKKPKRIKHAAEDTVAKETDSCDIPMTSNHEFSISSSNKSESADSCNSKSTKPTDTAAPKGTSQHVSKATEIFETEQSCPWNTSNVHLIQGYKYY